MGLIVFIVIGHLVEKRRRLRAVLVILAALYSAAIIASEIAWPSGSGLPCHGIR